jgi:signal transduction histidine kinase
MSVIQVQASTAKYRVPGLAEDAAAEFDDIAATARGSLVEMRRLLGVLRTEDQVAELAPQQGLDDLPALADGLRRVGADITLEVRDAGHAVVPPTVQIAAFRIVQEALSNAVRHAPGAPIAVVVGVDVASVRLRVHNGPAQSPGEHGAGHGLRGMLERAALLGGTLDAGPDGAGGWLVTAVLPTGEPGPTPPRPRSSSTKDRQ